MSCLSSLEKKVVVFDLFNYGVMTAISNLLVYARDYHCCRVLTFVQKLSL